MCRRRIHLWHLLLSHRLLLPLLLLLRLLLLLLEPKALPDDLDLLGERSLLISCLLQRVLALLPLVRFQVRIVERTLQCLHLYPERLCNAIELLQQSLLILGQLWLRGALRGTC